MVNPNKMQPMAGTQANHMQTVIGLGQLMNPSTVEKPKTQQGRYVGEQVLANLMDGNIFEGRIRVFDVDSNKIILQPQNVLCTNDAVSTVSRLVDMNIAPYLLASILLGILSQRLIRLNCSSCLHPEEIPDEVKCGYSMGLLSRYFILFATLRLIARQFIAQVPRQTNHRGYTITCFSIRIIIGVGVNIVSVILTL